MSSLPVAGRPDFNVALRAASRPHRRRIVRSSLVAGLAVVGLLLAGCEPARPVTRPDTQPLVSATAETDSFQEGMLLVEQLDQFDAEQAMAQAAYHLNRWLESQPPDKDWSREPLINSSLGKLAQVATLQDLDRPRLTTPDIRYLQQATWLRDIARWSLAEEPAPDVAQLLSELPEHLEPSARQQVAEALRLFDWTVRNIQLDSPPAEPEGAEPLPAGTLPAEFGRPGPGYSLKPWQTLLYGHGDAWLRARVFMLLARQRNLPSAVLEVAPQADAPHRPWVVAVLVDDQLYLFDPQLGLPLPHADSRGIVTLAETLDDPSLLEQLDVGQTIKYPVTAADLAHIEARVDASSEALSRRMKMLEGRLTGEQRMVLTVAPSRLAESLRTIRGIADVGLWHVPLEAELYELVWNDIRRRDSRATALHDRDMLMFSRFSPLLQGRQYYFRHQFERNDDVPGALAKFMEARNILDRDIDALPQSTEAQEKIGLVRDRGETDEAWQRRLLLMQMIARLGKHHASYWIGLAHYESGHYEDARSWFQRRTLESSPNSFWTAGARYNLGRSHEALGQWSDARSTYLLDQSPQRHGNLLRARRIRMMQPGDEASGEQAEAAAAEQQEAGESSAAELDSDAEPAAPADTDAAAAAADEATAAETASAPTDDTDSSE